MQPSKHSEETRIFPKSQRASESSESSEFLLMEVLKRANQEIFMDQKRILQKIKASWPDFYWEDVMWKL